ncbi:zinc-ribbon domain-containing protein [Methanobacterium sp.]|uniref:zinc ribbon domain-containing protein n=1 Tax=Methanobacterium sp. TaxID=2164 RepID=UPI0025CD3527|nr:zinc-ribbon domain-containing protein [Methanobacterium sp.]MBI5458823.1 zinc-ribbon domain-containing protein [Methanobacterium sp.]
MVKLCPECGEENDNSAKFCQKCSSPLTKELKTTLNENRENRKPIYALVTIIGVVFIIIDGLGLILNLLLVPLGLILTMGGLVRLFPKTFKPKAIVIGFTAFMVVYYLLFILSSCILVIYPERGILPYS